MTDVLPEVRKVRFADGSELNLAIYVPTRSGQGNPWHDPTSGQFTWGPMGLRVLGGHLHLQKLEIKSKRMIDRVVSKVPFATGILAKRTGALVKVTIWHGNKPIVHFNVPAEVAKETKTTERGLKKGISGAEKAARRERAASLGIPRPRVEIFHPSRQTVNVKMVENRSLEVGRASAGRKHLSQAEKDSQRVIRATMDPSIRQGHYDKAVFNPSDPRTFNTVHSHTLESMEIRRALAGRKHYDKFEHDMVEKWRAQERVQHVRASAPELEKVSSGLESAAAKPNAPARLFVADPNHLESVTTRDLGRRTEETIQEAEKALKDLEEGRPTQFVGRLGTVTGTHQLSSQDHKLLLESELARMRTAQEHLKTHNENLQRIANGEHISPRMAPEQVDALGKQLIELPDVRWARDLNSAEALDAEIERSMETHQRPLIGHLWSTVEHIVNGEGGSSGEITDVNWGQLHPNAETAEEFMRNEVDGTASYTGAVHFNHATIFNALSRWDDANRESLTPYDFQALSVITHEAEHIAMDPWVRRVLKRPDYNYKQGKFIEESMVNLMAHARTGHALEGQTELRNADGLTFHPLSDSTILSYIEGTTWLRDAVYMPLVEHYEKQLTKDLHENGKAGRRLEMFSSTKDITREAEDMALAHIKDIHYHIGDWESRVMAMEHLLRSKGLEGMSLKELQTATSGDPFYHSPKEIAWAREIKDSYDIMKGEDRILQGTGAAPMEWYHYRTLSRSDLTTFERRTKDLGGQTHLLGQLPEGVKDVWVPVYHHGAREFRVMRLSPDRRVATDPETGAMIRLREGDLVAAVTKAGEAVKPERIPWILSRRADGTVTNDPSVLKQALNQAGGKSISLDVEDFPNIGHAWLDASGRTDLPFVVEILAQNGNRKRISGSESMLGELYRVLQKTNRTWAHDPLGGLSPDHAYSVRVDASHTEQKARKYIESLGLDHKDVEGVMSFFKEKYAATLGTERDIKRKLAAATPGHDVTVTPEFDGEHSFDTVFHPDAPWHPTYHVEFKTDGLDNPSYTVISRADGKHHVDDVPDFNDHDVFPPGSEDLRNAFFDSIDALRGNDTTGEIRLYRGMSAKEHDAWTKGEKIPEGKFFTSQKTSQHASDIPGEFPNLYSFKVRKHDIVETSPGVYQLRRDATLRDGKIASDHVPGQIRAPGQKDGMQDAHNFNVSTDWVDPPKAANREESGFAFEDPATFRDQATRVFHHSQGTVPSESQNFNAEQGNWLIDVQGLTPEDLAPGKLHLNTGSTSPLLDEARALGKKPSTGAVVFDRETGLAHMYWRPGVGASYITQEQGWMHVGTTKYSNVPGVNIPESGKLVHPAPPPTTDFGKLEYTAPQVAEWAVNTGFDKWFEALDPNTIDAIRRWTNEGGSHGKLGELVDELRNPKRELTQEEQDLVKTLDGAFEDAPPLKEDMIVYRGMFLGDTSRFAVPDVGGEFSDGSYVSTAWNPNLWAGEQFTTFKITIPKGSQVIMPDPPSKWRTDSSGKQYAWPEITLPRGSRFQVTGDHELKFVGAETKPLHASLSTPEVTDFGNLLVGFDPKGGIGQETIPDPGVLASLHRWAEIQGINRWHAELPQPTRDALKVYQSDSGMDMNMALREGLPQEGEGEFLMDISWEVGENHWGSMPMEQVLQEVDKAFESAPALEKDLIVYRGYAKDVEIPQVFEDKGFASTSLDSSFAGYFGDVYKITIPAGEKIVMPDPPDKWDRGEEHGFETMAEVLLPRDSRFVRVGDRELRLEATGRVHIKEEEPGKVVITVGAPGHENPSLPPPWDVYEDYHPADHTNIPDEFAGKYFAGPRIELSTSDGKTWTAAPDVPDELQGQGYGKQLYKEAIKYVDSKGGTLISDTWNPEKAAYEGEDFGGLSLSPQAKYVWESLVKDGLARKVDNGRDFGWHYESISGGGYTNEDLNVARWFRGLDGHIFDEEKGHLNAFSLNRYLRDGEVPYQSNENEMKASIETMDRLIADKPLPEDKVFYRGLSFDGFMKLVGHEGVDPYESDLTDHIYSASKEGAEKLGLNGKSFSDKGYISTTPEHGVAEFFADELPMVREKEPGPIVIIYASQGTPALPLTEIRGINGPNEPDGPVEVNGIPDEEHVLPRGGTFHFIGVHEAEVQGESSYYMFHFEPAEADVVEKSAKSFPADLAPPTGETGEDQFGKFQLLEDGTKLYKDAKGYFTMRVEHRPDRDYHIRTDIGDLKPRAKDRYPEQKPFRAFKNQTLGKPSAGAKSVTKPHQHHMPTASSDVEKSPAPDKHQYPIMSWSKDNTLEEMGQHYHAELNGVPFTPGPPEEWSLTPDVETGEPWELHHGPLVVSTGIILIEPDGRIWIYEPKNHYGGYKNTFPKGQWEQDLSFQQNARKELFEETGLIGDVTGWLGDFEGDTSVTRFYVGKRTGGAPWDFPGGETEQVKLVKPGEAINLLNKERDQAVLQALSGYQAEVEAKQIERHQDEIDKHLQPALKKITTDIQSGDWQYTDALMYNLEKTLHKFLTEHGAQEPEYDKLYKDMTKAGEFQTELGTEPYIDEVMAEAYDFIKTMDFQSMAKLGIPIGAIIPDPHASAFKGLKNDLGLLQEPQWVGAEFKNGFIRSAPVLGHHLTYERRAGGSTGAFIAKDPQGKRFVVKQGDPDRLANEHLANSIYEKVFQDQVPRTWATTFNGDPALAGEYIDDLSEMDLDEYHYAYAAFATDAFLANWDVVGLEYDNLLVVDKSSSKPSSTQGVSIVREWVSPVRVDQGGALFYRAQGAPKGEYFSKDSVPELDTLRNPTINPESAKVFEHISDQDIEAGMLRLLSHLSEDDITQMVNGAGFKDPMIRAVVHEALIGRRKWMVQYLKDRGYTQNDINVGEKLSDAVKAVEELRGLPGGRGVVNLFDLTGGNQSSLVIVERQNVIGWRKLLTTGEVSALDEYKSSSTAINHRLRHSGDPFLSEPEVERRNVAISGLDSAMEKTEGMKEDMVVYRSLGMLGGGDYTKWYDISRAHNGDVVEDPGFVSTSIIPGYWHLRINVEEGTKGIWLEGFGGMSHEHELLLPRGGHFVVQDASKRGELQLEVLYVAPDGTPPIPVFAPTLEQIESYIAERRWITLPGGATRDRIIEAIAAKYGLSPEEVWSKVHELAHEFTLDFKKPADLLQLIELLKEWAS